MRLPVALVIVSAIALALVTPASAQPGDWTLVFEDEFEGTSLDASKWRAENACISHNNELQYYRPSDVSVSNGNLVIRTLEQTFRGKAYTSGLVETRDRFEFTYGRVDIRAKLPSTQGIWPAHWMLPADGSWPPEIDIMELLGHEPTRMYMTHHWGTVQTHQFAGTNYAGPNFATGFHTFSVVWDPNRIEWFVNGVSRHVATNNVPNVPMFIIINTAVGGNWPGNPDATTVFPQTHEVDYVRVYERTTEAMGGCCENDSCFVQTESGCAVAGGTYLGDGTDCANGCGVPGTIELRLTTPELVTGSTTVNDPNAGVELYVQARVTGDADATGLTTFDGVISDDGTGTYARAALTSLEALGFDTGGLDPLGRAGMFPSYRSTIAENNTDPGNGQYFAPDWLFLPLNISFEGNGEGINGAWANIYKVHWSSADDTPRDVLLTVNAGLGGYQSTNGLQEPAPIQSGDFTLVIAPSTCVCEFTGNTTVDIIDLLTFLALWFADDIAADVDGNGMVEILDLLEVLSCWFSAAENPACS